MPQRFKHFGLMGMIAVLLFITAACGNSEDKDTKSSEAATTTAQTENSSEASGTTSAEDPKEQTQETAVEPVKVVWWHSMSGELGKAVTQLVQNYNQSQDKVKVEEIYQGTYDESLNKMKASMDSKSGPSMIQVYEIGSRFMIDSKAVTPMQSFIDADKYDLSQLEPNITNYYTFDNKLYSMPFNTSNPILYYNKDMFKKAGLDPEKAPATFEEVKDAAAKLTASGQGGAGFAIYGWFMEQWFADHGADYINNGNGRSSTATESLLNQPTGVDTLTWWKGMIDEKLALNLGRDTADTKKAFLAGQIGMTLDSTAGLRGIVDSAQGKFEVGTGFLPKAANASQGGVVVGGASLWILNNKSVDEQKAAWDFIKYLTQPSVQAQWHVNTGYFPITTKAYDEAIVAQNLAKYPQFKTAVDQLHASKPSTASTGAVMGVFPEARQIVESAIEETLTGVKQPQQALDDGAKAITDKIKVYNQTVIK